jgi:hypothetical protein
MTSGVAICLFFSALKARTAPPLEGDADAVTQGSVAALTRHTLNESTIVGKDVTNDQSIMCVLCLNMDQRDTMLYVRLEHASIAQRLQYYICRPCAYVIAKFLRESGELSAIEKDEDGD